MESISSNLDLKHDRYDPVPEFSPEQKEEYLRAVSDLLGEEWLNTLGRRPSAIQELWKRSDWLSTSELLHFGHSLAKIRNVCPQPWLKDHGRRIKLDDIVSARGSIFEIWAAAMLSSHYQTVEYPKSSQAGYDLVLSLSNKGSVRISCKVLSSSAFERNFQQAGRAFFEKVRTQISPLHHVHLILVRKCPGTELPDFDSILRWMQEQLRNGTVSSEQYFGKWRIFLQPLSRLVDAGFSIEKPSLGLSIFAPYRDTEQKRIDDKIDEACSNLERFAPAVTPAEANVVFMKVPETISLEAATAFARNGPLLQHRNVSGIMFIRTSVCAIDRSAALGHESCFVTNPNAHFPLSSAAPSGSITIELLTGVLIKRLGPPNPSPKWFADQYHHFHTFSRLHHHYIREYPDSVTNYKVTMIPPSQLGFSCDWTFYGKKRVDLRFCHFVSDRNLVIL